MKQFLATSDVPEAIPANILDVDKDDLAMAVGSYKPGKHTLDDLAPAIPTLRKASGHRPQNLRQQKRVTSMPVFTMQERRQLDSVLQKQRNAQKTKSQDMIQDKKLQKSRSPKYSTNESPGIAFSLPLTQSKGARFDRRVFTDFCSSKKQLPPTPTSIKSDGHIPTLCMLYHTPANIIVDYDNDLYESMHSSDDDTSSLSTSDSDFSSHISAGFSNRYSTTASSAIHTNRTSILHLREESEYSYNASGLYTPPYLHPQYSHDTAPQVVYPLQSHYSQEGAPVSPAQKIEASASQGNILSPDCLFISNPAQNRSSSRSETPVHTEVNPDQEHSAINPVHENILFDLSNDNLDNVSLYAPAKVIQTYLERSPPASSECLSQKNEEILDTASVSSFEDSLFSSDSALVLANKNSSLYEDEISKSTRSSSPAMINDSAVMLSPAVKITRSLTVRPGILRQLATEGEIQPELQSELRTDVNHPEQILKTKLMKQLTAQSKSANYKTDPKQSYLRPFREASFLPVSGHFSIPPVEYLDQLSLNPLDKDFEADKEYRAPLNLPKVRKIVALTPSEPNSQKNPVVAPKSNVKPRPVSFSLRDLTHSMKEEVRNRQFSHCLDSQKTYKQYTRYFTLPSNPKSSKSTMEPTKIHDSYYKPLNTTTKSKETNKSRLISLQDPNFVPSLRPPPTGSYFLSNGYQNETNIRSNRFRRYVSNIA